MCLLNYTSGPPREIAGPGAKFSPRGLWRHFFRTANTTMQILQKANNTFVKRIAKNENEKTLNFKHCKQYIIIIMIILLYIIIIQALSQVEGPS